VIHTFVIIQQRSLCHRAQQLGDAVEIPTYLAVAQARCTLTVQGGARCRTWNLFLDLVSQPMRRDFCSVTAHLVSLEHPRSGAGCRAFFHDLDGRQRLVVEAVIDEGLHQGQEDAQTVRSLQLAEQSLFRDVARRFVAPVCVRLHYGLQTQDRSDITRSCL
jgi:hypothetical protein